jgi:hypothetical protein
MDSVSDQRWNPELYQSSHSWAWEYALDLEGDAQRLANRLEMFVGFALGILTDEQRTRAVRRIEELASPALFRHGGWIANYKRLRMLSVKA